MKNQVKVTKTENYKDSQKEDIIVCRGKLVLIPTKERSVMYGVQNKVGPNGKWLYFITETGTLNTTITGDWHWIQPIIISQTEETIACESPIMRAFDNAILIDNVNSDNRRGEKFYMILALPENFSPKQLQAIADSKLKDGDDALLECTVKDREEWMGDNETGEPFMVEDYFIKLNKDNHITLLPAKKEETIGSKLEAIMQKHSFNEMKEAFDKIGVKLSVKNHEEGWDEIIKKVNYVRGYCLSEEQIALLKENYNPPTRK